MIKLENVNFGYVPQKKIFSELNLNLEAGHIYGLLGKNGMGKTTLLKIIAGLRFANSGKAEMLGYECAFRNPNMLSELYFVTEEMDVPAISINEYTEIYSKFYPNFNISDFESYLNQFEITDRTAKLTNLSHGQKKKVIISFALATNTKVLIMDEPTNGMDIPSKSTFRKVVASAITDEKIMIISTHQVRDLQNVIDSVIVLNEGKILLNKDIETICNKLTFRVLSPCEFKELNSEGKILYYEENIVGRIAVCEHIEDADEKFDMELLFCAAIANSEKINAIFNRKEERNENKKSTFAQEMEEMLNN